MGVRRTSWAARGRGGHVRTDGQRLRIASSCDSDRPAAHAAANPSAPSASRSPCMTGATWPRSAGDSGQPISSRRAVRRAEQPDRRRPLPDRGSQPRQPFDAVDDVPEVAPGTCQREPLAEAGRRSRISRPGPSRSTPDRRGLMGKPRPRRASARQRQRLLHAWCSAVAGSPRCRRDDGQVVQRQDHRRRVALSRARAKPASHAGDRPRRSRRVLGLRPEVDERKGLGRAVARSPAPGPALAPAQSSACAVSAWCQASRAGPRASARSRSSAGASRPSSSAASSQRRPSL